MKQHLTTAHATLSYGCGCSQIASCSRLTPTHLFPPKVMLLLPILTHVSLQGPFHSRSPHGLRMRIMSSFSDLKKDSRPWPRRTFRTSVTAYAWPFTSPQARRASMSAADVAWARGHKQCLYQGDVTVSAGTGKKESSGFPPGCSELKRRAPMLRERPSCLGSCIRCHFRC